MVAAGEAGGILDTILLRLATFLEKNDKLIRKVKSAMIYPAVIFTVAIGAIAVLLIFVIPVFREHVRVGAHGAAAADPDRHRAVGLPAQLLVAVRPMASAVGLLRVQAVSTATAEAAAGSTASCSACRCSATCSASRRSRASPAPSGTLVSSGVSILDGLEITAKTAGNTVIHDAIMASRSSIAGGDTIAAPLEKSGVFPPMVISMIAVGEQTGGLDEMLSKIADFYDDEVDVAVSGLLSLLEPIMILFLGVIVGGMIVAMYLPIFNLMQTVQQ